MFLAYRDDPSYFGVGRLLGVDHQTVQRCFERDAAFGLLAASDDNARAASGRRSQLRPKRASCRWPARKPRTSAIRMSRGRRGHWRAMCGNMDRLSDTQKPRNWSKEGPQNSRRPCREAPQHTPGAP